MTDKQTPPDWVLIEAAKRCGWHPDHDETYLGATYRHNEAFRALCDMIERYEQPPVDRKVLCAREAALQSDCPKGAEYWRSGKGDGNDTIKDCIRAIELWEEGFGK